MPRVKVYDRHDRWCSTRRLKQLVYSRPREETEFYKRKPVTTAIKELLYCRQPNCSLCNGKHVYPPLRPAVPNILLFPVNLWKAEAVGKYLAYHRTAPFEVREPLHYVRSRPPLLDIAALTDGSAVEVVVNKLQDKLVAPRPKEVDIPVEVKHPHQVVNGECEEENITRQFISNNVHKLRVMIESRFELVSQLVSKEVLTPEEATEMRAESSVYKRNDFLLDLLLTKGVEACEGFLLALEKTGQRHVVNFIISRGRPVGDVRPLRNDELSKIYRNLPFLEEAIDTEHGFVDLLFDKNCISRQQLLHIRECQRVDRPYELIDIMTRRSFADFMMFIDFLYDSEQRQIAKVLEEGGEVISVDVELLSATHDSAKDEGDIVRRVKRFLRQASKQDSRLGKELVRLQEKGIELVFIKPGTVRLYFWCRSEKALVVLQEWIKTGHLQQVVEKWFMSLLKRQEKLIKIMKQTVRHAGRKTCEDETVSGRSTMTAAAFKTLVYCTPEMQQSTSVIQGDVNNSRLSGQLIESQPLAIRLMILKKSACRLTKTLWKSEPNPHALVYLILASVCQFFHQLMSIRSFFMRPLKQQLAAICYPFRMRPKMLAGFLGAYGQVNGLAKLHSRLYVIYSESDTINVFDLAFQPFVQLSGIQVDGLENPWDIVACARHRYLYIADTGGDCIWRAKVDQPFEKWMMVPNICGMSLTPDGNVVLMKMLGSSEGHVHGKLEMFDSSGVRLTILEPSHDISCPFHAVRTGTGSFVICHGQPWTFIHSVCEVDNMGYIGASYGVACGSGVDQLNTPSHVVMGTYEHAIVADCRNNRVILLNYKLEIQRLLVTWTKDDVGPFNDGVADRPLKLCYDKHMGQLIVGTVSGHIEIYQLRSVHRPRCH